MAKQSLTINASDHQGMNDNFSNFISGTRIQDSTGNRIASTSSTNQQATDMAHVSFMQEQSKGTLHWP